MWWHRFIWDGHLCLSKNLFFKRNCPCERKVLRNGPAQLSCQDATCQVMSVGVQQFKSLRCASLGIFLCVGLKCVQIPRSDDWPNTTPMSSCEHSHAIRSLSESCFIDAATIDSSYISVRNVLDRERLSSCNAPAFLQLQATALLQVAGPGWGTFRMMTELRAESRAVFHALNLVEGWSAKTCFFVGLILLGRRAAALLCHEPSSQPLHHRTQTERESKLGRFRSGQTQLSILGLTFECQTSTVTSSLWCKRAPIGISGSSAYPVTAHEQKTLPQRCTGWYSNTAGPVASVVAQTDT